ncbi:hypothetical protein ACH0CG_09245 [Microbacterium sp. 179-I 1D1 NHS]|uniref:hypothetical protein n=1 Tax=Microbacterium sp. 179-I 1D1 NHS TaxID=3374298 RepID=UPI00387A75B6
MSNAVSVGKRAGRSLWGELPIATLSRSKPERFPMVPVAIVLAVLSFLIAMGYGELAMAARA